MQLKQSNVDNKMQIDVALKNVTYGYLVLSQILLLFFDSSIPQERNFHPHCIIHVIPMKMLYRLYAS